MARRKKGSIDYEQERRVIRGWTNNQIETLVRANLRRKTTELALRELLRRKKQKVKRKKGYINVMGKWVRVD